MKVVIYHKTIPNLKNQEKIDVLRFFSDGVRKNNDECVDNDTYQYIDADVGVLQGWVHTNSGNRPHLNLRKDIINTQVSHNKHVVAIDSNLFLYANTENPLHYLRYSFNDVFPNTGNYCDTLVDPTRWTKISKELNLSLKEYRTTGDHILLLAQRNGGWSMGNYDVQDWCINVIHQLRQYTDRPIVIRGHPGDKESLKYLNVNNPMCRIKGFKNVTISNNRNSLVSDLKNCWAVVNHNSSPVVGAAIEGIPVFVTDITKSQCREIANTDLTKIETPALINRQAWVERISMFHWNFNELKSGECWSHMRTFV